MFKKETKLPPNEELAIRCTAGNLARQWFDELSREVIRKDWHSIGLEHFWETLGSLAANEIGKKLITPTEPIILSDTEARHYENTTYFWRNGSHANNIIRNIPTEYLIRVTDDDPRLPELKAYVRWRLKTNPQEEI